MKLINNRVFYNLENYLDMASFDAINDKICYALSKNYQHFSPSGTSQNTLFDQSTISVYSKRDEILKSSLHDKMTIKEAGIYAKLLGTATLGTNFILRGNIGYPATYSSKHMRKFTSLFDFDDQFKFLFDWIDAQNCFSTYGRVIFWINEPGQVTAYHTDYPTDSKVKKNDPFIWLTGKIPKQLRLLDPVTNEVHYSNAKACVFNTNNIHSSIGHPQYTAWSLRIDGMFNKEWAQTAGIAEHFNLT
jgi:hypothetical protein